MTYEWKSEKLRNVCKALLCEPFSNDAGAKEFHLRSVMHATISASGHGKSLDEAKSDLEANIANLYPNEVLD